MEAEGVVQKILADADAEAEKIKNEAQKKQDDEQAKLEQQLDEFKNQTKTLAEKAAKDEKSHLLAAARMDIAKQHLAEKRKILDEVFEKTGKQLQNLPVEQYRNLMVKLILAMAENDDAEIIIGENENRIDRQLINEVNDQLSPGKKGNLKLSHEKRNIGAGFILKRGKIKTNVSIDVLLDRARKELEIKLAKELF